MLTVVTPATNKRLTTVSAVREFMSLAEDEPADAVIEGWIDRASQAIVDYCGREFASQVYRETDFPKCATQRFTASRFPVTAVDSISYGGNVIASDQYLRDKRDIYRLGSSGRPYGWGPSTLIVQYAAGYTLPGGSGGIPLPSTIELACLGEISAQRSRASRDPMIRSESEEGVGSTSWQVSSVGGAGPLAHPESAGLLSIYKMTRVA